MRKPLTVLLVLLFCTVASQNARAQSDVGLKAAGFELGVVDPEHVDATIGFKGFLDLGTLAPNVGLSAQLGFWTASDGSYNFGDYSLSDLSLGMRGTYMFNASSSGMVPFAGAGLGLHFLHASVDVPNQDVGGLLIPGYTADDSSTKLGLEVGGGLKFPMGQSRDLITEAWYGSVDGASQFSVHVGMAFPL